MGIFRFCKNVVEVMFMGMLGLDKVMVVVLLEIFGLVIIFVEVFVMVYILLKLLRVRSWDVVVIFMMLVILMLVVLDMVVLLVNILVVVLRIF